MECFNLLLTGVGGQGIVLLGRIVANATIEQDLIFHAIGSYGMSRRGGSVSMHLRIGDDMVLPEIPLGSGDLLIGFEPLEALRGLEHMKDGAQAIINSRTIPPVTSRLRKGISYPSEEIIKLTLSGKCQGRHFIQDFSTLAEEAGNPQSLNIALLGGLCALEEFPLDVSNIIKSMETLLKHEKARISWKINKRAFDLGREQISNSMWETWLN